MTGAYPSLPEESSYPGNSKRGAAVAMLLAAILIAGAFALRLPYLQDIPRLTDETDEVGVALDILHGARPLVSDDPYRGPVWAYLLAGVMAVTGVSPAVPRLFAASLGALTAGVAFAFAYELAPVHKRVAGTVAAAGTATATGLVTLGSHVAWSNNSTPLWVLLGAWAVVRASATGRTRWWVAGGLAWAAALQSHPSAIAPLLGVGVWWVAAPDRRLALRSRGAALGAVAFLALMSPMVVQNVREPLSSVTAVTADDVPVARDHSVRALAANAAGLARQIGRFAGAGPVPASIQTQIVHRFGKDGPMGFRADPQYIRWLEGIVAAQRRQRAATWIYAILLLGSLALCLVRGSRLVGAMAAASLLLLPIFNRSWENPYDARYVGFLVALGWVAIGTLAAGVWGGDRLAAGDSGRLALRRVLLTTAVAALVAYPVRVTFAWYSQEVTDGRTNAPYRAEAARVAAAARASGAPVLVDRSLRAFELGGGGNGTRALEYLLRLEGAAVDTADESELRWYLDQPDSRVIIVASGEFARRSDRDWINGIVPSSQAWAVLPLGIPRTLVEPVPPDDDPYRAPQQPHGPYP